MAAEKQHTSSILTKVQVALAVIAVAGVAWLVWTAYTYLSARGVYDGIRSAYAQDATSNTESIDFDALTADCPNAVAWIHFEDANIKVDYPVMQTTDNSYYLTHDATEAESKYGAIFLDYRNNSFADDLHTIIYGHNMLDEGMFGGLHKYDDEDYFKNNDTTFWVATKDHVYHYQIFAVAVVSPTDNIYTVGYKNAEVFSAFVQTIKEQSIYDTGVSVSDADRVLTLSTCSIPNRLVVSAKLVGED